ncbi:MAG: GAF domain-containing protein [Candidatus Omnitrophota bacterium]|jgi:diguanylate cyclase (GGDEF)-like protein/PAS domain S-box-containing protein
MDHTKLHNLKVFGLIFISSTSFVVDLLSPWAAVNCVYFSVIFFGFLFFPRKHLLPVTGVVTVLMAAGFLLQYHGGVWIRDVANHILVLIILWQLALLGLRYQTGPRDPDEAFFSLAAEEAIAVIICKPNSFIDSCNKGFEKLSGFTADELAGRFLHTILLPGGKDLAQDILRRIHAWEERFEGEAVLVKKNRIPLDVSWQVSTRRSIPGALISFAVYFFDSTEEQKARKEFRRQEEERIADRRRFMDVLDFEERMRAVSDPRILIAMIVSEGARILQAEKCSLMSVDPLSGQLKIKGYQGIDPRIVDAVSLMKGDPIAGWVAEEGQDILVKDIESDPRIARSNRPTYATKSFMSVPIYYKEEIIGVINVADHESGRAFEEFDYKILSRLAHQLGPVLGHAELLQEISRLKDLPLRIDVGHYRGFKEALLNESLRSQRYNTHFCVFIIRVNNYQAYIDAFGNYQAGILTKNLKAYLKQNLREVDVLFQLAQDEFAVISPHLKGDAVQSVVSRIHNSTRQISSHRDMTLVVGVFPSPPEMPPDDILERFNQVFKESGEQDRNSVVFLK